MARTFGQASKDLVRFRCRIPMASAPLASLADRVNPRARRPETSTIPSAERRVLHAMCQSLRTPTAAPTTSTLSSWRKPVLNPAHLLRSRNALSARRQAAFGSSRDRLSTRGRGFVGLPMGSSIFAAFAATVLTAGTAFAEPCFPNHPDTAYMCGNPKTGKPLPAASEPKRAATARQVQQPARAAPGPCSPATAYICGNPKTGEPLLPAPVLKTGSGDETGRSSGGGTGAQGVDHLSRRDGGVIQTD